MVDIIVIIGKIPDKGETTVIVAEEQLRLTAPVTLTGK